MRTRISGRPWQYRQAGDGRPRRLQSIAGRMLAVNKPVTRASHCKQECCALPPLRPGYYAPEGAWVVTMSAHVTPDGREADSAPGFALAMPVDRPPGGSGWLHEVKFDGYRLAARLEQGKVVLLTRSGLDWTARFPEVAEAVSSLAADDAVIDGEVVASGKDGRPDFSLLQAALADGRTARLSYQVFDLLQLDSRDVRPAPLEERKELLAGLLAPAGRPLRFSGQLDHPGGEVFDHACRLGIEGIISKRKGSPYRAGRSGNWLKSVCLNSGDFVIVGFSSPQGQRAHFGALLLAEYAADGSGLKFVGRVGTGFTEGDLAELSALLAPLVTSRPPFSERLTAAELRGVTWVRPALLAEVSYPGRTGSGRLRQARFKYLREDKPLPEASSLANPAGVRKSAMSDSETATVQGVRLSNPQRVLYPEQGITKLELAEYYEAVGEEQLRWLQDRPLSLVRCPEGREGSCFYQKHPGAAFAEHVPRIVIDEDEGQGEYLLARDTKDVVALVQAGVLEIHAWGSRASDLDYPDVLIFDLDPDDQVTLTQLKEHARQLRDLLARVGLTAFVRVTGGKGLHLVTPIEPDTEFPEAKAFSKAIATEFARLHPEQLTVNMSKAKRKGRVFIDYLRNGRGATAISNWSTRARAGAPVAVPIRWDELGRLRSPAAWKVPAALRRLRSLRENAWTGFEDARRSLRKLVAP